MKHPIKPAHKSLGVGTYREVLTPILGRQPRDADDEGLQVEAAEATRETWRFEERREIKVLSSEQVQGYIELRSYHGGWHRSHHPEGGHGSEH